MKSRTWLSDFTFTFPFCALEKDMATHSSFLAWRIPGTGEPGGLPSMGSHRVGHDSSDLAAAAACRVHHEKCWAGGSTSWNQDCGRNINNLRYADDTTLMAESEEEIKSLLMEVKEESKKAQHSENKDHGIWSHHFMGNRWGNSGSSDRLYFFGFRNHCRW